MSDLADNFRHGPLLLAGVTICTCVGMEPFAGQSLHGQAFVGQSLHGQAFVGQSLHGQAFVIFAGQSLHGQAFVVQSLHGQAFVIFAADLYLHHSHPLGPCAGLVSDTCSSTPDSQTA
ncbi:hypothetical protein Btru_012285 [Bulinus truncatus]|nr:hypothetical protein Btru_012285 [Bulinus truncatus]